MKLTPESLLLRKPSSKMAVAKDIISSKTCQLNFAVVANKFIPMRKKRG